MKVTYIDHCGTDLNVVNAARVSFKKHHNTFDVDKDNRLIKYLAKHNHKSPFNHCFISMHVKAPIFVARQLVKHKFMPWNEVSRRYVDEDPEFYWPKDEEWRKRAEDKKQGSADEWTKIHPGCRRDVEKKSLEAYRYLLDVDVAPEQARMVLPLNTYTEWYWSGTLGAWADMYNLRSKADTQWETQQIALQCGMIIAGLFPVSWRALTKDG